MPFEKFPNKIEKGKSKKEIQRPIEKEIEEKIQRPWTELEQEEEQSLFEKYKEGAKLSDETRESIDEILQREIDQKKIEYAIKWFDEHKKELEAQGISSKVSEEKKVLIALEKGALEELKTKKEYKDIYEEIENLNALRVDLGKEYLHIESQFLLLNFLEKKAEKIKDEIEEMKKEGLNEVEISVKEKELDDLFKLRKELAEKVSGRDLKKEAGEKVNKKIPPIEKYIENQINEEKKKVEEKVKIEIFWKEWEELSLNEKANYNNNPLKFAEKRIKEIKKMTRDLDLDEKTILAFLQAGYDPKEFKEKGVFLKKIKVGEKEKISRKEFQKLQKDLLEEFNKTIEEKAIEELNKQWDKEYQKLLKEEIEKRIKELATSPEKAEEGIKGMFQELKETLIAEWFEKNLKTKSKTKEKVENIEKIFERKGKDLIEFLKDAHKLQEKLTGNLDDDVDDLIDFLSEYEIEIPKYELMKQFGTYKKVVKKERGFIEWLFDLIFKI